MPDKRQSIFEDIKSAFALVAGGSYNFTVRHRDIGFQHFTALPEDKFPALLVAGANEQRENVTNSGFKSSMKVSVVGYVRSANDEDSATLEQDLNKLIADATKALYVDPTRGGNSTYTEVTDVVTDKGAFQPFAMFEMTVEVDYRATFAQP